MAPEPVHFISSPRVTSCVWNGTSHTGVRLLSLQGLGSPSCAHLASFQTQQKRTKITALIITRPFRENQLLLGMLFWRNDNLLQFLLFKFE